MSLQALGVHQSHFQTTGPYRENKLSTLNRMLRKVSLINLNDMSKQSEAFARQTWKCKKCGFNNYTDVWACGQCGRPKPT